MTNVRCRVHTCYYWGDNDICKADSIMVDNNTGVLGRGVSMEAGDLETGTRNRDRKAGERSIVTGFEAGDLDTRIDAQSDVDVKSGKDLQSRNRGAMQAHTSHQTLCSTFKPKGSEPRH